MLSTFTRSVGILLNEGLASLVNKASRKLQNEFRSLRSYYSLSIGDIDVSFSAPTTTVVGRNRMRFESERQEFTDFLSEIEPDDVVYDIGANTGLYTLFAAQRCPQGDVIAFEPYPPNVALLEQDISRNKLENVEIQEVALSDSDGTVSFDQPSTADAGYGSSAIDATASTGTIEKPTATGDALVAAGEIPEPNVVKIDVEGAEPLVIDGLEDALSSSTCRLVYCEVHLPGVDKRPSIDDFGATTDGLKDRFKELGFTVEVLGDRSENELFFKAQR